jgi:hypothetical protein
LFSDFDPDFDSDFEETGRAKQKSRLAILQRDGNKARTIDTSDQSKSEREKQGKTKRGKMAKLEEFRSFLILQLDGMRTPL